MKPKDLVFDADELLGVARDLRDHLKGERKIDMRTARVDVPRTDRITPEEIAQTRAALNMSQEVFARVLNVPLVTEASWERGRRHPSGAALRLLQVARKRPDAVLEVALS